MIDLKKDAFFRLAIETGMNDPGQINKFMPLGSSVEEEQLRKWLRQLTSQPKKFAPTRRYVNRFKLGADPEFCFVSMNRDLGQTIRVNAQNLGLAQGPAFGSDNNGRLGEIRPFPSRSAVEVVASILTTLRWMAILNPHTLGFEWQSGAFLWEDGIGGHVHFGRKRPFREREIKALDAIEEALLGAGVFPSDQIKRRRQGDAHRQVYGMPGDFRLQPHGYEYRTYPSWLDSPDLAFLTMTVSKLAVQRPDLFITKLFTDPWTTQQRLRNFLSYFKWTDDDARLALVMLGRGVPIHRGGDFRDRWGIYKQHGETVQAKVIPLSIKPDRESIEEVFNYLLQGIPLRWRVPEFTWGPVNPPRGMRMCLDNTNTILTKGIGELVWDLCVSDKYPVRIQGTRETLFRGIQIAKTFKKILPKNWRDKFEDLVGLVDLKENNIVISPEFREGSRVKKTRELLLNGLLPIWRVKDAKEGCYEEWLKRTKEYQKSTRKDLRGSVVFEDGDWRIGPLEGRT